MMKHFKRGFAALLVPALVALAWPAMAQKPPVPTLIGDAVREETASETAEVVGRFIALRSGPIAARIAGAVDEVLVSVGDRVKEGQPLVRLALDRLVAEKDRRQALVNLAAARIRSANASLRLAQQSAARLAKLRNSAAFSEALLSDKQREAERAAAQVKEAEADFARARAELKLADVDLAYADVRAPYAGVVAERHVDVGGFVALGAPVVTLVGDEALEVEVEAPTDRMEGVVPNAMATVRYRGVTAPVPVRAVLPRETGVSRTRTVRFGPAPPDLASVAIANASVTVSIPVVAARTVLTLHKDAVLRRPNGGALVVVAKPSDDDPEVFQVEHRPVELGSAVGSRFIVLGGVRAGERVVIRGNESLRPGQTFKLASRG